MPPATLRQLQSLLRHPALRTGHVGVAVEALGTVRNAQQFPARPYRGGAHPLLFAQDPDKRLLPASNLKLFTAALALQQLGPEYTFQTRVLHDGGVLQLVGGGDPSLSTDDLADLARQIAAKGITPIETVGANGGAFRAEQFGGRYPFGWTLDDAIWYYGPPISALAVNRNQVDVNVTAAGEPGNGLRFEPPAGTPFFVRLKGRVATPNAPDAMTFDMVRENNGQYWLSGVGDLATGHTHTEGIAVPQPEAWAARLFRDALQTAGVPVKDVLPFDADMEAASVRVVPHGDVAATHTSLPVRTLLQKFLKTSDNLYGEMLLRDAALYGKDNAPNGVMKNADAGTAAHAHLLLRRWLHQNGINDAPLRFEDGSGLSRYDLLTPRALADLLRAAQTLRGGEAFYGALPIAGVDGTLKKRMVGTAAQNNARAKTGTFSTASCLSGYVTTRDGQRLAVSVMTNYVEDGEAVRRIQDRIFAVLAAARFRK